MSRTVARFAPFHFFLDTVSAISSELKLPLVQIADQYYLLSLFDGFHSPWERMNPLKNTLVLWMG